MNYLVDDQPIVACSTSMSDNAAIGVIRLSGFANLDYIADFFSKSDFKPNTAKFTKLIHLDKVIDEVVVTFFQAPHSYNGENVLEISAHGNILNLRRIIGIFVNSKKFRMAANGEFTYRALKNKKLNLSQVEGLDLLLNANSTLMLDQGLNILNGDISKKYHKLYDAFLHLKSSIEINIDFAEDVGEEQSLKLLDNAVRGVGDLIRSLHASANVSKKYFATPSVTVVGEPNAGKSSLFNAILNDNRAIVSPIAGTTRDFITEYIEIADNNFKLVDTAGLRFTKDVIEEEGIKRATNLIGESFFKVLVVDVTKISEFSFVFSRDLKFDLLVLNHADEINKNFEIPDFINIPAVSNYLICSVKNDIIYSSGSIGPENSISGSIGPILENIKSGSIGPEKNDTGSMGPETKIGGSIGPENNTTGSMGPETKLGGSIGPSSKISDFVTKMVGHDFAKIQALDPISIDRHRNLINEISISYETFSSNINNIGDMAIISSEAHILGTKISELIGILSPDDILNNIFSNFCIGK